jgi:hypothetical protein
MFEAFYKNERLIEIGGIFQKIKIINEKSDFDIEYPQICEHIQELHIIGLIV